MTEYIDIEDIEPITKWPYLQWIDEIPEGKAIEITEQLNGQQIPHVRAIISGYFSYHSLPLIVMVRKGHIFIAHPKPEAQQ